MAIALSTNRLCSAANLRWDRQAYSPPSGSCWWRLGKALKTTGIGINGFSPLLSTPPPYITSTPPSKVAPRPTRCPCPCLATPSAPCTHAPPIHPFGPPPVRFWSSTCVFPGREGRVGAVTGLGVHRPSDGLGNSASGGGEGRRRTGRAPVGSE